MGSDTRTRHVTRWGAAVALTPLLFAGCSAADTTSEPLTGTVSIDGSSTVAPLAEAGAKAFVAANPDVKVTVVVSGTTAGFAKFCAGEVDLVNASRPINAEEQAACEANGIAYNDIAVANDGLTILVNPDSPLECITIEQLQQIWDDTSTVQTWGDVATVEGLDIPAAKDDLEISLYGPGDTSGTFDFFTEAVNGTSGQIRADYTSIGEDDAAAVTAVANDPGAMAFVPYSFYQEVSDEVKAVEIDGGGGCVAPSADEVQAGNYTPLGRPLFIYASNQALAQPATVAFLTFMITDSQSIAQAARVIPLTRAQQEEQETAVERLTP
jgi:phosphate transport system substrate-binding protein